MRTTKFVNGPMGNQNSQTTVRFTPRQVLDDAVTRVELQPANPKGPMFPGRAGRQDLEGQELGVTVLANMFARLDLIRARWGQENRRHRATLHVEIRIARLMQKAFPEYASKLPNVGFD